MSLLKDNDKAVIFGGCLLAFGAAFTNTALVMETSTSVSHLTGDITKLSISLANWSNATTEEFYKVLIAAISFLLGAVLSGILIHHPSLDFKKPYGRCLTLIGVLILGAFFLVKSQPKLAIALTAFGCGFQNALSSHYRETILRTTHLTGLFTDLGVALGMKLRGYEINSIKIRIPVLLVSFFILGCVSCSVLFINNVKVLLVSGVAYLLAGFVWIVLRKKYLAKEKS